MSAKNTMARVMKNRSAKRATSEPFPNTRTDTRPLTQSGPRSAAWRERAWTIREFGSGASRLRIIESPALAKLSWLVHGFSTRIGGESRLDSERVLNLGFTPWDKAKRVEAN